MALCINVYCTLSDDPPLLLIEDYWASHLGTGTLGNYQYVPVMSYHDALSAARHDESDAIAKNLTAASVSASIPEGLVPYKVSSPLAITTGGSGALNKTKLVSPVQWQLQYNYLSDFEANEKGYWAVIQTVIHSVMLWGYYVKAGSYAAEILRLYWIWGIVGTVAVCAIVPLSLLKVRQRFYEFFIVSHIALSLLFLIGYYYHIWYVYQYNWGYEIWMYVPAGIWALERLIRVGRMVLQGSRTAIVTLIPQADNEYIRIDIEGKALTEGVAYLCFPTLSWRFWETHPFSVSGSSHEVQQNEVSPQSHSESNSSTGLDANNEKKPVEHTITDAALHEAASGHPTSITTFFARARGGVTKLLTARAFGSAEKQVRLRVLIDGPYNHSGGVHLQIAQCSSVLCIAGGVGITACLPFLRRNGAKPAKLFWSSRKSGLVEDLTASLNALPSNVKVETLVGQRFDLDSIIYKELIDHDAISEGSLAIVVSGPPGLADDVRIKAIQFMRGGARTRPYVLVDEAFSW
ncbi:hypothetical protein N0V95_005239 [Ascochyta clinopodiicola]|nr:hypothetical protein N0V95_005239 [Ascochyta clinopodiicola]